MVKLYLDVHIPFGAWHQLQRRGVDVLHATQEGHDQLNDESLLRIAMNQSRILVTSDHRFRALAEQHQRDGLEFAGLIYCPAGLGIGVIVSKLEWIAKNENPDSWRSQVIWLHA